MKKILFIIRAQRWLYSSLLLLHSFSKTIWFGFWFLVFRLFPLKKNKVLLCSFNGKGFGDNPKYLALKLLQQQKSFDLVWQLHKKIETNSGIPTQIRTVRYGSLREIYELCTAKVWIDNTRKPYRMFKRRSQFYIQTWHGSIGVKMVEKDALDSLTYAYLLTAKADSRMANLFIANGKHIRNLYRNSFWYEGEILEVGSPRNDIFFKNTTPLKEYIARYFSIPQEARIVLYAPTFRNNRASEIFDLDYNACVDALKKRFGGEWVVLMRLHPNRAAEAGKAVLPAQVRNATRYDDMQELLAVTDVLITDYSSSVFDYALRRKPAFLFTPDEGDYVQDRGFYFKLSALPFPKAVSNNMLTDLILQFDETEYISNISRFYEEQEVKEDGTAAQQVVARIVKESER